MTAVITLTTAGTDSGPFNLYSNLDGFVVPFVVGVLKASLLSGYTSPVVPDFTSVVRVQSIGQCVNYIDIPLQNTTTSSTTLATTSTTTSSSTITTTTTAAPIPNVYPVIASCCGFGTTEYVVFNFQALVPGNVIESHSQGFIGGYVVQGPKVAGTATIIAYNTTVYVSCSEWDTVLPGTACDPI